MYESFLHMNIKNQDKALAPFSCNYTPQIPDLLSRLNCSLSISTYQAGKLVFLSPKQGNAIIQLPRTFAKPMGIAYDHEKDKLGLATKDEIIIFRNSSDLAKYYPNSPKKYDSLFMPRSTYHTGPLDIHDLHFGADNKIYAVNTLFSCIVTIDDDYNFTPYWKPNFIDKLVSEDRCHLNGLAFKNGKPKYATAFNTGNSFQSWRDNITKTGVVIDVETDEIIAEGLAMPHSPRLYNDELYVLMSATGELVKIDVNTGEKEVMLEIGGFVRGMDLYKDYLFVGLSKFRENSSTFAKLDFKKGANQAGIVAIHLPSASIIGKINYLNSLDEIYDIKILPDKIRPNIMNTIKENYKQGLMIPNTTFWAAKDQNK